MAITTNSYINVKPRLYMPVRPFGRCITMTLLYQNHDLVTTCIPLRSASASRLESLDESE